MKILSLECSAGPASAAVLEDGNVLAHSYINRKITHSQTLLPMVSEVLSRTETEVFDLDGIAVSAGPGSFTGIRIGISAVKGLAAPNGLPCVGVSTLSCMAENLRGFDGIVCAVMDARCNQVYNALFRVENGVITRLCDDRAVGCEELANELQAKHYELPIYLVGDGAKLFYRFSENIDGVRLCREPLLYQNAVGVGLAALPDFKNGKTVSADKLLPIYLRLSQAERELKKKQQEGISL